MTSVLSHQTHILGLRQLGAGKLMECELYLVLEGAVDVVEVADAASHAGRHVAADGAQAHDHAAGHVLAAVVAGPLHHRLSQAHCKISHDYKLHALRLCMLFCSAIPSLTTSSRAVLVKNAAMRGRA